ncbi:MAG: response regulator transcription factor [Candidatus Sulfotelmatobacter sp.]
MGHVQQARSCVNVVIAEANHLNCQLVESAFRVRRMGVAIVASAIESHRALLLLKERKPDIAVISSQLGDGPLEGFRLLRELRLLQSKTRSVMLLASREPNLIVDAFRCGARGVVFRDEPLEVLGKCIHAVNGGQIWANSQLLGYLLEALTHAAHFDMRDGRGMGLLSKREIDIVQLVAEGLTNRAVSLELHLSEHTVRNYLFRIFDKLGVSTRVELVLYCFQERQQSLLSSARFADKAVAAGA